MGNWLMVQVVPSIPPLLAFIVGAGLGALLGRHLGYWGWHLWHRLRGRKRLNAAQIGLDHLPVDTAAIDSTP